VTEDEARATLKAQGRDDTPQAVADLMGEDSSASVEVGPSEGDVSAHDGDAGTSPAPSEEAPLEPQGHADPPPAPEVPEPAAAPVATPEEIQAAAALIRAAGYSISPTPEAI
jgi:hypothetical protein